MAKRHEHVEHTILALILKHADHRGYATTLPTLTGILRQTIPDITDREIVNTLKRLSPLHLALNKYSSAHRRLMRYPEEISDDEQFFCYANFSMQCTPHTDPYVQTLALAVSRPEVQPSMTPPIDRSAKRAVILTALYDETRAVLRHLGNVTTETVDGTGFHTGRFEGWDVAVAEVGPGNAGAAAIAVRALGHYKPEVALFVGVAGGVKDVEIGDVVVGTKVYGYESGKDTTGGFKARADLMNTAHELEQHARLLRQSEDWKKRLDHAIKHQNPRVFVEPISAGEKVVASKQSATAKLINEHYGDALAVEMEGRGFLEGVHISHPVQGCVVRGISDLLTGKVNADKAGSQQVAADAASAVAFGILSAVGGGVAANPPKRPAAKFIEVPSTFSPSTYFKEGEVLARVGDPRSDELYFSYDGTPEAFLRIIPSQPRDRPIPLATLNEVAEGAELLRVTGHGGFTYINDYGAILYEPPPPKPGGPAHVHCTTQLFQNGELWSVSDSVLIRERGWRPAWVPVPLIPAVDLEQAFYRALHGNIVFATKRLGLSCPCTVELGLVGLSGAHLGVNQDDIRGPIRPNEAIVRKELSSTDRAAVNELLLEFFNEVYDRTGYARAPGLFGFPPGPPRG